jgi:hypothetical protein
LTLPPNDFEEGLSNKFRAILKMLPFSFAHRLAAQQK